MKKCFLATSDVCPIFPKSTLGPRLLIAVTRKIVRGSDALDADGVWRRPRPGTDPGAAAQAGGPQVQRRVPVAARPVHAKMVSSYLSVQTKCEGKSVLSTTTILALRRWNLVVTWVPMWVAPNLITMVGLVLNVATSVLLIWSCPTATEPVNRVRALLSGAGSFEYPICWLACRRPGGSRSPALSASSSTRRWTPSTASRRGARARPARSASSSTTAVTRYQQVTDRPHCRLATNLSGRRNKVDDLAFQSSKLSTIGIR